MMLASAFKYFADYDYIAGLFTSFGYPLYIIYPLAIAKVLGIVAIISNVSSFLKHLAYAGFFFEFILAFFAHFMIQDGEWLGAIVALVLLIGSFVFYKRMH